MINKMMDPWMNTLPGSATNYGIQQVMRLLTPHCDEATARRVVRQALVRGKTTDEMTGSERSYIEKCYRRDPNTEFRLYRGLLFIYSKDCNRRLITAYKVKFPKGSHFQGKKQIRDFRVYKQIRLEEERIRDFEC